ncbi:hypothetical protein DFJ74DRAFT_710605 [Hyaloraphidium curvatum]|nr:hypothetical protein DFJ74DRAFT_710605 [Hyaloraphidium curvatum]
MAVEYARRRTRASFEELRGPATALSDLRSLFHLYGEACLVEDDAYSGRDELDEMLLRPPPAPALVDWKPLAPEAPPEATVLAQLASADPLAKLTGIRLVRWRGVRGQETLAALAALLASRDVAPRDALSWPLALHEPVAPAACELLTELLAGDGELADEAVFEATPPLLADAGNAWTFEQASFDQGGYIGKYGSDDVRPWGLADRLVPGLLARDASRKSALAVGIAPLRVHADAYVRRTVDEQAISLGLGL